MKVVQEVLADLMRICTNKTSHLRAAGKLVQTAVAKNRLELRICLAGRLVLHKVHRLSARDVCVI